MLCDLNVLQEALFSIENFKNTIGFSLKSDLNQIIALNLSIVHRCQLIKYTHPFIKASGFVAQGGEWSFDVRMFERRS